MVAVAEIAKGHGAGAGSSGNARASIGPGGQWVATASTLAMGIALAWGAASTEALANPTGGVVIAGQASFNATQPNKLVVTTQNAAGANYSAINWQSFSIPAGSTTQINQPNAASLSINRVVSNAPSVLFGTLASNGKVVLVNQSGITVGTDAVVDTAGFTASALKMSDADALAGRLRFGDATVSSGTVSVQGSILARSGDVVLIAPNIDTGKDALIQSPNGSTILAAGQQVEITGRGLEGISMQVQAPTDQAVNLGTLKGDAVGIFAGTLKHSGQIVANTVANEGGRVVLRAARLVEVAGTVSASGTTGGSIEIAVGHSANASTPGVVVQTGALEANGSAGAGGAIHLSADNVLSAAAIHADGKAAGGHISVQMADRALSTASAEYSANSSLGQGGDILVSAQVSNYTSGSYSATGAVGGNVTLAGDEIKLAGTRADASGANGGGTIHVGGLMHGASGFAAGGTALGNASTVLANGAGSFKADALQSGNGGEVVLWADQTLRFSGNISAKGGAIGGDGGQAEVSGRTALGYNGVTNLSAPNGVAGSLLLDPKNITITAGGVSSYQEILDPTLGAGGGGFGGAATLMLPNGHIVVAMPNDNMVNSNSGAVYHFDAAGLLLSTLTGSQALDHVGSNGLVLLNNGNYLVKSHLWNNVTVTRAGAVTWNNGATGITGLVSAANSLVGSTLDDQVGGGTITPLPSGNYLVSSGWTNTSTGATAADAVTWGSGTTGVSGPVSETNSLVGSTAYDRIGSYGITVLTNGNYVVNSPWWINGGATLAGAVTWGSGTSGVTGVVSAANSLIGTTAGDQIGYYYVTPLPNGNYLVGSTLWDNGGLVNAGALTWGSGTSGVKGVVSASNSLVGANAGDGVGYVANNTLLANGNYLVTSANGGVGALTWGSGTAGVSGIISSANSLVGSTAGDGIGNPYGILKLSNGNYVLRSPNWSNGAATNAGAVTWGSGTAGVSGTVSASNSLVGTTAGDAVGSGGMSQLANGNYVIFSPSWNNGASTAAGAVTWGNGNAGVKGAVSASNSLVGSTTNDHVGNGGSLLLSNGNYVVNSPYWTNSGAANAGAVTWGNGTTGVSGVISSTNSLVGSTVGDYVGLGTDAELSNGNYVVTSSQWNNGSATLAGAVTWGSGTSGVKGVVSSSNSLVGTTANDMVGGNYVTPLSNGNYLVKSSLWNGGMGAVTWGNGTTGVSGNVSLSNSLVGSSLGDLVGNIDPIELVNGNYVVGSPNWANGGALNAGAATWGSGTTGISGAVSVANSLVGSTASDVIGYGVTPLANGNYVVISSHWNNGPATWAGAVTWGSGTAGVKGVISSTNSLVGSTTNDQIGAWGVTTLSNGNYVVISPYWTNPVTGAASAGAVTWGSGTTGVAGAVSESNSLVGSATNDGVGGDPFNVLVNGLTLTALSNGNYLVSSPNWSNGAGAVTWGSGATGVKGVVSSANSLVGTAPGDNIGNEGITELTNGNYVVGSPNWANGVATNAGAITWGSGTTGVRGVVSAVNSLVGTNTNDAVGRDNSNSCECADPGVIRLTNGNYVVNSQDWNGGVGALTWGSGATGVVGSVSSGNSALASVGEPKELASFPGKMLIGSGASNAGAGGVFLLGAASATLTGTAFADTSAVDASFGADNVVATLRSGTNVVLQANTDITVNAAINVSAGASAPGTLTLQAGRSVVINAPITTGGVDLVVVANDPAAISANRDPGVGAFVNNAGTGAFNTGAGRWLVYSNAPASNTFGGLDSANLPLWGKSYAVDVPANIPAGDWYLFTTVPALAASVVGGSIVKTYGTATATPAVNITGWVDAALYGNVFTAAPYSSTLAASSSGFAANAHVVGSPYLVTFTGTVTAPVGYGTTTYGNATVTVNPAPLTATITNTGITKVYDGSNAVPAGFAPNYSVGGLVAGDTAVSLSSGAVAYNSANVVGATAVVASGVTVASITGSNGSATSDYILNGGAGSISVGASITPASANISSITALNKVYDGTTAATVTGGTLSGILSGDVVTLNSQPATFNNKNVGVAKPVTVSGLALTGVDASNYRLGTTSASTVADITAKPLTVSGISAANKVYDATTAATVSGGALVGAIAGDALTLSSPTGSFADKNAGLAKPVAISNLTLNGADAGNYAFDTSGVKVSADITPKPISVGSITAANKVYDATPTATLSASPLTGIIAGDSASLNTPKGDFADANVGAAKPITVAALTLSGVDAANYALAPYTAPVSADITVRPLSTWTGAVSNQWSDPKNWDALPVGNNVLAVSIPAGVSVEMNGSSAATTLQSINSAGSVSVTGGNLTVSNSLNTAQYSQTGGSVTGAGSLTVTNSFSQSAGSIALAGPVSITHTSGPLAVGDISASAISLNAPGGGITQSGALVTPGLLSAHSANGATLNNTGNRVSAFTASSSAAGNIELTNTGVLNANSITTAAGDIKISNTGGVTANGVVAHGGSVTGTANSPLTVGIDGVEASGDITLVATNLTSSGNMTLDGPLTSTGGSIALDAANDFVQNSTLRAAKGIAVAAGGTMTFGPEAFSFGNPVSYMVNGSTYLAPWQAASLSGGANDFVVSFLDKFAEAIAMQSPTPDDPFDRRNRTRDTMVVEGEICAR